MQGLVDDGVGRHKSVTFSERPPEVMHRVSRAGAHRQSRRQDVTALPDTAAPRTGHGRHKPQHSRRRRGDRRYRTDDVVRGQTISGAYTSSTGTMTTSSPSLTAMPGPGWTSQPMSATSVAAQPAPNPMPLACHESLVPQAAAAAAISSPPDMTVAARHAMLSGALQYVVRTGGVLTGNVAVLALCTIRGVPPYVWTLAIVAPHGVSKHVYAAQIMRAMQDACGGSGQSMSVGSEFSAGAHVAGGRQVADAVHTWLTWVERDSWIEIVSSADGITRLVTVSDWPVSLDADPSGAASTWIVPIIHNGETWLPRCFRPATLRAQALLHNATSLVTRLDEIMATRTLRGMFDGIANQQEPSGQVIGYTSAAMDAVDVSAHAASQRPTNYVDKDAHDGRHGYPAHDHNAKAAHSSVCSHERATRTDGNGNCALAPVSAPAHTLSPATAGSTAAGGGTAFVTVASAGTENYMAQFPTSIWAFAQTWAQALLQAMPLLSADWAPPNTLPGLSWPAVMHLQRCAHDILRTATHNLQYITPLQAMLAAGVYVPHAIPHFLALTFLGSPDEVFGAQFGAPMSV